MKISKAENAIKSIDMSIKEEDKHVGSVHHVSLKLAFKYKAKKTPLYGKVISWWCKSPYYHIETILFDKYWISASWNENVYIRDLGPLKDTWDYVELNPLPVTDEQITNIIKYLNEQNGTNYDRLGIFLTQVIKINLNSPKDWICSELAAMILQLLGVKKFFTQIPCTYSPGDIYKVLEEDINKVIATGKPSGLVKSVVLNSKNIKANEGKSK